MGWASRDRETGDGSRAGTGAGVGWESGVTDGDGHNPLGPSTSPAGVTVARPGQVAQACGRGDGDGAAPRFTPQQHPSAAPGTLLTPCPLHRGGCPHQQSLRARVLRDCGVGEGPRRPRDQDHVQLAARRRRGVSITHQIDLGRVGPGGWQPQQHEPPHWGSRDTRQPCPHSGTCLATPVHPEDITGGGQQGPHPGCGCAAGECRGDRAGGAWSHRAQSGSGAALSGAGCGARCAPRVPTAQHIPGPILHPLPRDVARLGGHLPARHPLPAAGVPLTTTQTDGDDGAAAMGDIPAPACSPSTATRPAKGVWWLPVTTGPQHTAMSVRWGGHCRWHGRSGGSAWCGRAVARTPCKGLSPAVPSLVCGCQGMDPTRHPTRGAAAASSHWPGVGKLERWLRCWPWRRRERAGSVVLLRTEPPALPGPRASCEEGGTGGEDYKTQEML